MVYANTPLAGPAPVLEYWSRYTHRTAISNERIVAIREGDVLRRGRADANGGQRVIRLEGLDFMGRFLHQVLPPGFKRIRHFGLLSPAHKRHRLAAARQALHVPAPSPQAREAAEAFMKRVAHVDIERCPCGGQGLLPIVAVLRPDRTRQRQPPPALASPPAGQGPPA